MRRKFDVCPLGCNCEEVKEDKDGQYISTCKWLVEVRGKDPQSEMEISEWRCSLAWTPTLLVENSQTNRGQTGAMESFRNEMVKGQEVFNGLMQKALKQKVSLEGQKQPLQVEA